MFKVKNIKIIEINTTVKQEVITLSDDAISTPNDEEVATKPDDITNNPKTGDSTTFIIYGLLVTIVSTSLFLIINKKEEYEL